MKKEIIINLLTILLMPLLFGCNGDSAIQSKSDKIYVYTLNSTNAVTSYDEAMAVACIQGILNREGPRIYVRSDKFDVPDQWLEILSNDGWLSRKTRVDIGSFDELMKMAKKKVRGIIIWDPEVPATINVATTLAGLEEGIVMSPAMAEKYRPLYKLKIIKDFRGQFDGSETGSKKNDAYRWAIREYMDKGLCNIHRICLYEDSYFTREAGNIGYVVTRDWAVYGKCFVYDLSPWGDEKPKDDLDQKVGLDKETYTMLLESLLKQTKGKQMTEQAGFFSFNKYSNMPGYPSSHEPVPTEWENVYLISRYNCYQNTVASDCYNQSFHSQAPQKNMTQGRPELKNPEKGKTYIAILMADYDSATPLYEFMLDKGIWHDKARGQLPLLWGINPNLCETYPDVMQYIYSTRTPNDWFAADASCAGYFNPNRIQEQYLPLFVQHNKKFYEQWDMSISPMVLDTNEPTDAVKDAFAQFSPDGFSTIVMNYHGEEHKLPDPQVWKGMPVGELLNDGCNFSTPDIESDIMSNAIPKATSTDPRFFFFRIVWTKPSLIIETVNLLKQKRPDLDIEVLNAYDYFHRYKMMLNGDSK
jgi:hypothetical protein